MLRPLIVITGTGTEIGKTHFACALLSLWGRRAAVCGLKPVETGVPRGALGEDAARLAGVSTFHVKHTPPFRFIDPISPHLAARRAGEEIRLEVIARYVSEQRDRCDGTLVELAGGLFSPLSARALNGDAARILQPSATILVAPDRLGVLHDVAATTRAAVAEGISLTGIVLVAPATPDASTGTNGVELQFVTDVPFIGAVPRSEVADLADHPTTGAALRLALGTGDRDEGAHSLEHRTG